MMNKKDNYVKILTFIVYKNEFLLLLGSSDDPQFHKSFWYVVTGGCEDEDFSIYDSVKREVYEETKLNCCEIIDLDWKFEYDSLGKHCIEHAFVSFVDSKNVVLNEESIDYKWCNFSDFIDLINWHYDKDILKEKLENFINKKGIN